ncbi:unnamed protein product [Cylicocyclus nassatus]|uniref:Uncharacterized protein n=1 Tax=Cylicocyclus nassatus TaxID=53992 RepID=A0AA36GUA7_CYLNA|nr:unnamed protein product [Cylicocyclus nassatus]
MWFRLFALAVVVSLTLAKGSTAKGKGKQNDFKRLYNIQYLTLEEAFGRQRSEQSRVYGGDYLNPYPHPQIGMRGWGYNGQSNPGYNGRINVGYYGQSSAGYNGQSNLGYNGRSNVGYNGQSNAGYNGQSNLGYNGRSSVGYNGRSSAGYNGQRNLGYNGQSIAGYNGWSNLGYNGQRKMSYGQSNVSARGTGHLGGPSMEEEILDKFKLKFH